MSNSPDKAESSTIVAFLREQARVLSDPEDWHGPGVGVPSGRMEWQAADLIESLCAPSSLAREEYELRNPLGGPASMFRMMASRIEAGENYDAVLADYGFVHTPAATGMPDSPLTPYGEALDLLQRALPLLRGHVQAGSAVHAVEAFLERVDPAWAALSVPSSLPSASGNNQRESAPNPPSTRGGEAGLCGAREARTTAADSHQSELASPTSGTRMSDVERALWLADKLVGDYGSEAAQLLRKFASSARACQHFPLSEVAVKNLADWMHDGDGGLQEITLHIDFEGQLSVSITEYPEEGAMPLFTPRPVDITAQGKQP